MYIVGTDDTRGRHTPQVEGPMIGTRAVGWMLLMPVLLVAAGTGSSRDSARSRPSDAKRHVRNHTLVSRELPRMEMTVDSALTYIGSLEFDLKQTARVERHVFGSRDSDGRPERLLIVQFESILPGKKDAYTFGIDHPTRLGACEYQTQTGPFSFHLAALARPGAEAERTKAFLAERKWPVDGESFVVARYARVVGADKRAEIIVFYYENVRLIDSLRSEPAPALPSAGVLRDLEARARASFAIRDTTE